jgi:hypothetical protein
VSVNSKSLVLSAGLVAFVVWNPLPAQSQTDTPRGGAPQFPQKDAQPPMRDFQEMIENQRSQIQDRITAADDRIRGACSEELRKMGEVIAVKAGLDGKPQMIHAELGALFGLGTSVVLITPDELQTSRSDGLQLRDVQELRLV